MNCPFCGSNESSVEEDYGSVKFKDSNFLVICSECGASSGLASTKAKALDAWNTRSVRTSLIRDQISNILYNEIRTCEGVVIGFEKSTNKISSLVQSSLGEINQLQKEIHQVAIDKGWYEAERSIPELLCLVHAEVSETLEAYRNHKGIDSIAYELADIVIRVLDMSEYLEIDLNRYILEKHKINQSRYYRHGGKKC